MREILGYFLLKSWPHELEGKNLKMFLKKMTVVSLILCGISFVDFVKLIDQNNSFMDIGPINYILVCCLTLMNNLIFFNLTQNQNPGKFMFNETM